MATRAPGDEKERLKTEVRRFWEQKPCGSKHADAPEGSAEYFAQVEKRRYELEPFIPRYADFSGARGKRLLEIGIGLGTDFVRFGRAGALLTGLDLTERSIELVGRRCELEGIEADLVRGDAEQLPFDDASFDRVYSWGVLMVTPDTPRAISEAIRVLKPGGHLTVMVYARHSWVAFGLWARYGLLAGKPRRTLADVVANHMESQGMKAYTRREVETLFGGLEDVRIQRVGTPYDRRVAGPIAALTGERLGWFIVVNGRKPA
jgi:ubiquinone/menaquinone biosynthesis C-methylase UbiE